MKRVYSITSENIQTHRNKKIKNYGTVSFLVLKLIDSTQQEIPRPENKIRGRKSHYTVKTQPEDV
jgi:hypothetical protein